MTNTKIQRNFDHFEDKIKNCLLEKDIMYFVIDLSELFNIEIKRFIDGSQSNEKIQNFIIKFKELQDPSKYNILNKTAEVHNKWIYTFLNVDLDNNQQCLEVNARWVVLEKTLDIIKKLKGSFCLDEIFINELFRQDIISKTNKDFLCCTLNNKGEETTLYELFNVISMKDPNWYGKLLVILHKQSCNLIEILFDDQERESVNNQDYEQMCLDYAKKFIDQLVEKFQCEQENLPKKIEEDNISDYGSLNESDELSDFEDLSPVKDEEIIPEELVLKSFQEELAQLATTGKNVIIYAPTGSGKTNVAVYIANEHLKKNPNGKIAFLVHRIPLISQQHRVFKKYKSPNISLLDIRGRSDNTSGPLIAHLGTNQIIVMTSDILRNALTNDDGNKINSISEFSLIFFDECHNCMKSHPYTKIMLEYFKLKRDNPNSKLPQIVGLTASPRSNKKDDFAGMKKSLFELCANLDCFDISMVKIHKKELEEFVAQPKQDVILPKDRNIDEFQDVLINQMINCESKLEKMRSEHYFQKFGVPRAPDDKFLPEYVSFVGNLERLNTETVDECDGKQKAYCIYRYLNAYYRGLIVNQMFDRNYAQKTIKKYLKHNGTDFTCAFDVEFYEKYENSLLNENYGQSSNPSIDSIVLHIKQQFSRNKDSRILIFVREIDFTCYLVDILKSMEYSAEAIVGSNAKTDLKVCSDSEINKILFRFHEGITTILVATTVVEEGLDIALCNMVVSYGHVTNETAMIQRKGRVRAVNSKYILILPPMLSWLERKEKINERRKEMMMQLISQLEKVNVNEMKKAIDDYQSMNFYQKVKKPLTLIETAYWRFTCKSCQTDICTTNDIRIIENAHRICIIPELLKKFKVVKQKRQKFGSQGFYERGGKVLCHQCNNYELGSYVYYRNVPFFQVNIRYLNATNADGKSMSFKKWAEFAKFFELKNLDINDREMYTEKLSELEQ